MRRLLLKTYFRLRPTLPRTLRMPLRRFVAKRAMHHFSGCWSINELAGGVPDWWTGWPGGRRFAFVLTHDVEGRRGLDRCRDLAALEMRSGFRSSFNFVPEGEYQTPRVLREFLAAHGFEVGVHDLHHDGRLWGSQKEFRRYAQRINHYLAEWGSSGFRSGFMLHNFEWLQDLKIAYDASSFDTDPFEPQPDGTNTIFPFWVGRSDISGYVELPYTLPQDSTLFLLLRESGIGTWVRKLDWIARHGGMALVITHPDYMGFDGVRRPSEFPVQIYRDFLEYVANRYQKEAWFALPGEVATHIRQVRDARIYSSSSCVTTRDTARPRQIDGRARVGVSISHGLPVSSLAGLFDWRVHGKRVAIVVFSLYSSDPRPRRAAETLVSMGMKVELICLGERADSPRHEIVNGIDILRIPMSRRRSSIFRHGFEYGSLLLDLAATLAGRSLTRGYDLVYVYNLRYVLILIALVPKLCGANVVLDLQGPTPKLVRTTLGFGRLVWGIHLLKKLSAWNESFADAVIAGDPVIAKLPLTRPCQGRKTRAVTDLPDEIAGQGQEVRQEHHWGKERKRLADLVVALLSSEVDEHHPMAAELPLKQSMTL